MPSRPRSRLLACAIAALVFACASAQAAAPRPRDVQPREPISRHRRAMFHGVCFGRPSVSVRRRSRSKRSGCRTDGEVPLPRAGSTELRARLLGLQEARGRAPAQLLRALRPGTALDDPGCGPATCSSSTSSAMSACTSGAGACTRRPPAGTSRSSAPQLGEGRLVGARRIVPARVVACEKGTTMAHRRISHAFR